jgi:hypothetical protein
MVQNNRADSWDIFIQKKKKREKEKITIDYKE